MDGRRFMDGLRNVRSKLFTIACRIIDIILQASYFSGGLHESARYKSGIQVSVFANEHGRGVDGSLYQRFQGKALPVLPFL